MRINFDDIWQNYSKYSRIEFCMLQFSCRFAGETHMQREHIRVIFTLSSLRLHT